MSYNNPPIEEALCEFTFTLPSGAPSWDLTLPGKFQMHDQVHDIYSGTVRQQNIQTILAIEGQPGFALQNALFRVQIPTIDDTRLISLGQNTLAVSVLKPYEGWSKFKPRIASALGAYFDLVKPINVTRIGLRYVNRISVPLEKHDPSIYLLLPHPEAKAINAQLTSFTRRGEYRNADGVQILITQATLQPAPTIASSQTIDYLLDIDVVLDDLALADQDSIMNKAEKLHAIEGATFEALITNASRDIFNAN